jgi:2'-5' RNA ligase
MRVFLAFEIPAPVKEYIQGITREMASRVTGVRWIKSDGQHITVRFFGEIEETMATSIQEKLSGLEGKFGPFETTIKVIDAFPNKRRARVILIALEKGVDMARTIFHDIEHALTTLGFEKENRDFTPHITLGRKKEPTPLLERDIPGLEEMSFVIDGLVLFKSTLTPQGAIYTKVWEIGLKGRQ